MARVSCGASRRAQSTLEVQAAVTGRTRCAKRRAAIIQTITRQQYSPHYRPTLCSSVLVLATVSVPVLVLVLLYWYYYMYL
jgi:hypothetical protein